MIQNFQRHKLSRKWPENAKVNAPKVIAENQNDKAVIFFYFKNKLSTKINGRDKFTEFYAIFK